jgi:hypothetical protein
VIRQAAISCERSSPTGRSPKAAPPSEQPARLLDRHWFNVMLREVRLHQFGDREGSRDSLLPSHPFQLALQSFRRVPLGSEPATLHPLGVSAANPVSVRPQRFSFPTSSRQPDQLALLRHQQSPLSPGDTR